MVPGWSIYSLVVRYKRTVSFVGIRVSEKPQWCVSAPRGVLLEE